MISYFPKYLSNKITTFYLISLVVVTFLFFQYSMPLVWLIWGVAEVVLFCWASNHYTKKWYNLSDKQFEKKLFWLCFFVSLVYVIITYFLYVYMRGEPFEYDPSDGLGYHEEALWFKDLAHNNNLSLYWRVFNSTHDLSDKGYLLYLDFLYLINGGNIFITRVLKCVFHGLMCVLIYRLSYRHFGKDIARMAAIFCVFLPNFNFYVASHRKEMEMIFLSTWFLERADYVLRKKVFSFKALIIPVLLIIALFTLRTVLGIAALASIIAAIFFADKALISQSRKIKLLSFWGIIFLLFSGGAIYSSIEEIVQTKLEGTQGKDMEWRSKQKGGNEYAKYAGAAVFAPMIVAIPFPTMIDVGEHQYNHQRMNGGYFLKNILAFFVLASIIDLWKKKELRTHMILYAYTFSYLLIVAFSNFAHSERFHLPALPFLMIMAAYGICVDYKNKKKYFNYYCFFILFVVIAWNVFKLAGRGLV